MCNSIEGTDLEIGIFACHMMEIQPFYTIAISQSNITQYCITLATTVELWSDSELVKHTPGVAS